MNEKKIYQFAGIAIVLLDRDLLLTSGGELKEGDWDVFDFGSLS